ncbi:hypothetical protein N0V93_002575 [Gnomoniopsis smithogilvyi]|uniref:Uncharacterized protein n=1 Tax=Gnomoniopsis smithogilvyi TaxID=1191159 RepID=A0A9W8YYW9_9PEZI|nr:hypothetical protein N0V93_002575 [Gnomoniopsis smithogilvyi]
MLPFVFLAALAGSVAAAPRPAIGGPSVDMSEWTVRADWSRCSNASAYEAVLQGVISAPGTTAGVGIVDFQVPAHGFSGSLVLKPVGSYGFGSPYPPRMINVDVLEEADADGNFGVATYEPPKVGSTNTEIIAQVAWFTDKNQAIVPASEIEYNALQLNTSSSAATKVNPSFLRVYYCSHPAF